MNQYVTGAMIKRLREEAGMTQAQLGEKIFVSDKTVSKWETGRGYPDITLLEPLAAALGVSVIELFAGRDVVNTNRVFNLLRMKFYVCPVCGNVITSVGEAVVSCCGIALPPLEAEEADEAHAIRVEAIENEYYVSLDHPMSKAHHISFLVAVSDMGAQLTKLYPEGDAAARFRRERVKALYACCNRHGLYKINL